MSKHPWRPIVWLLLIGAWLAACSSMPSAVVPQPTDVAPTAPVAPAPTSAPAATSAAIPTPSATPEPTPTAAPTARATPVATATTLPIPTSKATPMNKAALAEQLIRAAEAGDTPAVLRLVAEGADLNGRDALGRTPVMAATHGSRVATVQALLQAGADVNLRDNRLDNPFLYAGAEGLLEILRLTIAAGADTRLTNRFGGTALIPAAERGHVEVVKELLTRTDVAVNHVNSLGWTALLEAIILGAGGPRHTEVVRLLVAAGADLNLADSKGVTPLQHAQQRGFGEIIAILQAAGAR